MSCASTSSLRPSTAATACSMPMRSARSVTPQVRTMTGVSRRNTSPASVRSCTSQRARASSSSAWRSVAPKCFTISAAMAARSRSVMAPSDWAAATIMTAAASRASSTASSGLLSCLRRQPQRRNSPRASSAASAMSRAALAACCMRNRIRAAAPSTAPMMAMICMRFPQGQRKATRRAPTSPAAKGAAAYPPLAYDLIWAKIQRNLGGRILRAVRAVHRVALDALGELLADGAGGGLGRVGGAHHVAVGLHRVLTLQHLHHDGSRGHERHQVAVEGSCLVHLVELLRLSLAPAHALLGDDPEAGLLNQGVDGTGQIARGGIRLDDRQRALDGHPALLKVVLIAPALRLRAALYPCSIVSHNRTATLQLRRCSSARCSGGLGIGNPDP